jgi:hypothetical protein
MTSVAPTGVELLLARAEIHDRILAWTRGVDRLDWGLAASAFHPGAIDDHGIYAGPVDGLIEALKARHRGIEMSMHMIGNVFIEFGDAETAAVESYCLVWQRYSTEDRAARAVISGGTDTSDLPIDMIMSARYVDRFGYRDGAWKIDRRTTVFERSMRFDVPEDGPKTAPEWTAGQRGPADALMQLRREIGLG